jgi:hypothetical protein
METTNRENLSLPSKQHTTPRSEPTMISRIHESLKTKPNEGLTIDGILDWIRDHQSMYYQQRGQKFVRTAIQNALRLQSNRKKPTVWEYADKTWRLDEASLAKPNAEKSTETHREIQTYTPSLSGPSSRGGRTSDGTPESYEGMPELQQSRAANHENGQDTAPTAVPQVEPESRPNSTGNQPRFPAPEPGVHAENGALHSGPAMLSTRTSGEQISNSDEPPTQQTGLPAESTSTIHNDNPSGIEEAQVSVNSCDGTEQDGEDEPDFGAIVWELRRMKKKREAKELEIKKGHHTMPDLSVLTQSAEGAQHAADEARRAADEAQAVAEAANRALEEALAKQRQIVAAQLDLETLIRDSDLLRSKLDID